MSGPISALIAEDSLLVRDSVYGALSTDADDSTVELIDKHQSRGHDVIHRFAKRRLGLFLTTVLALYFGCGVLLPLGLYKWVLRSPWWLAVAVVCAA